jgi:glycosyltransferase involved in cell wall biosynthesis
MMVRVLFFVAPFKRHMMARMAEEFSSEIVYDFYPFTQQTNRKSPNGRFSRFLGTREFRDLLLKFEPDLIYSDSTMDSAYYQLATFRRRRRPPLIQRLHGDLWREFWDWYGRVGWRERAAGFQIFTYNWAGLLLATKLTPACRWLDHIAKHYLPRKRTEVVYQGVDPASFFQDEPFNFERPAFAIIQNHAIYSKVEGLIQFKQVAKRLREVNFYVAEGETSGQNYLGLIKSAFSELKNVHFVSEINSTEKVRRMLSSVDGYILASGLDCCPTTVLEASLMRRPVIASRIGGVPEIILEGKTGWSIENSSIEEWVEKIRIVLNDAKLNRKLGDQGREWVKQKFAWQTIAKQVEHLIISEIEHSKS